MSEDRLSHLVAMPTNPILSYARSRQSAAFGDKRLEKRGRNCTRQ